MKKLPEITVSEWLEAEKRSGVIISQEREPNSKTVLEYAADKGVSERTAQRALRKMARTGFLESRKWHDGQNVRMIYWPKPKNGSKK